MANPAKLGHDAEHLAAKFLLEQGLQLVTKNFRSRSGEIDLIMQDKQLLIFFEVKARTSLAFGTPIEFVSYSKQQKIIKTATYFLKINKLLNRVNCRFDVIGISYSPKLNINWIRSAFETF